MAHHRGGLAVETRLGMGTAFGIWLPAARQKPMAPEPETDHA
jgi:two-component system phosphate regulon sensor histidine kinase PhoR